ncbi:MAG: PFL family protein [Clostridia bacterium]|nr:PFL family protein [Clostridia bacterium]
MPVYSVSSQEILETIHMVEMESLDIRTITMGISLRDCCHSDAKKAQRKIYDKITRLAENLVKVGENIAKEYGIPIVNKRISVTPIALVAEASEAEDYVGFAKVLDQAAKEVGVNFLGGFSALVHKGFTKGDLKLLESIPQALAETERVCASVNVATTKAGINMDAVYKMGQIIVKTAELTKNKDGLGCAKLVVFCNVPEDNPFMAGAFHGIGEPESVINVGVSGPGVVLHAIKNHPEIDFGELATIIKKTAFKITRMGELVGREASRRLNVPFGIIDLSLAPTPAVGDSVAEILQAMGLERVGTHGTTAALAMLNDAVKKGGVMASSHVGGLSGAFIPVSEDAGMIEAVEVGALSIDKLEAMTCVCSVGLDMIAVPGDTSAETIAAIIADEAAIGMINRKTTAVRIIPVPGKGVGEMVEFGGLLGRAPIMPVNKFSSSAFVKRGGRIPAPLQAFNN